jgi:hypothetical protein
MLQFGFPAIRSDCYTCLALNRQGEETSMHVSKGSRLVKFTYHLPKEGPAVPSRGKNPYVLLKLYYQNLTLKNVVVFDYAWKSY